MLNSRFQSFSQRFSTRACWQGLRDLWKASARRTRSQRSDVEAAESRLLLSSVFVSGTTRSDSLAVGEQDIYTFTAKKGDSVTINLARTTSTLLPTFDVFSPSGRIIYDGFSGGSVSFDVLLNSFTETGTYTAIVKSSTATGSGLYNISFVQVPAVHTLPVDEGVLVSGVTRAGSITAADIDVYTFDAVPGNAVTLNLAATSTDYVPEIDIFAPNGKIVYNGPDGGSAAMDILLNGTNLPQSGTYTVLVKSGDGGRTGTYNLTYAKIAGTPHTLPVDEGALVSGVTKFGTITPSDIDLYTFQAAPGNAVTIDLARTTIGYTPEVDVFAPDGSLVFDGIASGIGSFDIFLNTFVQTGTYTVLVKSADGANPGNYNLTYTKIVGPHTLPVDEGALTSGVTRSGTLIPSDIDLFTFVAIPGDAVTLNLGRTSLDYTLELDVFDPTGKLVYDGATGGLISYDVLLNSFTLPGTYTVQVKSADGGRPGTYNLTYVKLPGTHTLPADEGVLVNGASKTGTITVADIDLYTFQAAPGSAVTLNLSRTSLLYYPEVDIFAPNGALVYDGPAAGAASYDLLLNSFTQTGTYTVMVKDSKGGETGDYNMTFVQIGQPLVLPVDEGALVSGVTKSADLTAGDIDTYTFQATAGNAVTLNLASTRLNYSVEVDVFAPDGTLVYDGPTTGGTGYDLLLNSFTQTGLYTVVVKSANGGDIGTYNMTYVKVPATHTLPVGEGALTSGQTLPGTLNPSDIDVYTFNVVPGNAVKLDIARTTTKFMPEVNIFDPTGKLIYSGLPAATYNLTLQSFTVAGRYTVLVKASDGKSVGEYYIRYNFFSSISALPAARSAASSFSLVSKPQNSIV